MPRRRIEKTRADELLDELLEDYQGPEKVSELNFANYLFSISNAFSSSFVPKRLGKAVAVLQPVR